MSDVPRDRFRAPIVVALLLTLVLSAGALGLAGTAHATYPSVPTPVTPVTGSITGPAVLAYNGAEFYTINGSGGPAVSPTGEMIGNISYYASLSAANLTGVTISPGTGIITNTTPAHTTLTVSNVSETITIRVMISSVYLDQNQSINLTYAVLVVQPYHLTVSLRAGPTSTVLSFQISFYLDGQFAGLYTVPTLTPGQVYTVDWEYATPPFSSGWHTFTITMPTADKGLVTFPNGQYNYAYSFYITGPAPDYTIWIVLGVVAFVAVVFISLILVGGRRRNRGRP
ncbi:MAG: hypothetical protein ABSA15_04125 [Thermoplasmata archaeon]|jgi:hypothetical protein